jgi:ribonuclease HII
VAARRRRARGPNAARAERRRLAKLLAFERDLWGRGLQFLAGVDEVGRGPLAGPVVAAAVVLPRDLAIRGVDDSKRLPASSREELAVEIRRRAISVGIGAASSREIDRMNVLRAAHLAVRRALARLSVPPEHVLVDGLPIPNLGFEHTALVEGDMRVHSVACASIVAKVTRDRLMRRLARAYPGYGWEHNAGYATAEHREALARLGPTPHHRLSFAPLQPTLDLG